MSESREVLGRSPLHWAIVLGVGLGVGLGAAELLFIDIGALMPDYSLSETIISFGLLALIGLVWLNVRDGATIDN